ncbi:hypothetical protein ABPG72_015571 [Tetrahymena utriculariae]
MSAYDLIIDEGQAAQEFAETISEFSEIEEIFLEINPYYLIEEQVYLNIANRCSSNMKQLKKIQLIFGDHCKLDNLSFITHLRALQNEFTLKIGKTNNLNHFSYINLQQFLYHQEDLQKLQIQIRNKNQFVDENLEQLSLTLFQMKYLLEFSFDFSFCIINQKGTQAFSEALKSLVCLKKFNFYNSDKYSMIEGFSFIFDSLGYMKDLIDLQLKGFNLFQQELRDQIADIIINKIYLETLIIFFNRIPEGNQIHKKISLYLKSLSNLKNLQVQISYIGVDNDPLSYLNFLKELYDICELSSLFEIFLLTFQDCQRITVDPYINSEQEHLNLQIQSENQIDLLQFSSLGNAIKTLKKLKQLDLFIGDCNRINKQYFQSLFEGIQFKFEILGNALRQLTKQQSLNIQIETQSITYKQISDLCGGLKQLSYELIQNLLIAQIYHEFFKNSNKNYESIKDFNMSTAFNLKEFRIQLDVGHFSDFGSKIKQFFESAQNLVVVDIEIVYNMVTQYGTKFQKFLGYLLLPSSIEDLLLIFVFNKQIQSDQLMLFQIFQNIKNLKELKLEFQNKITKGIIFDLDKCLSYCKQIFSLSLRLGFSLYQREGQSLISMIKQLSSLKELELNLPHFTQFEKQFVLQFKETLSSLKNLYSYNQNVKFLQRKEINQYDHIQNLHNLVECWLVQNQDPILKKIQINHRVSQKLQLNYSNLPIDQINLIII